MVFLIKGFDKSYISWGDYTNKLFFNNFNKYS